MRLFGMKENAHGVQLIKELPPFLLPIFDVYDYVEFYPDDKRKAKVEGTVVSSSVEKMVGEKMEPIYIITYVIVGENEVEYVVNEDLIVGQL